MNEILYLAERNYIEKYLKERAQATHTDMLEINSFWKALETIISGSDTEVNKIYSVEGDTAHIRIEGALSPEGPDAWDLFWGYEGCSFKTIQAAMEKAKNDNAIKKVIFDIDSPGGTLAGTDETWQAHKELAAVKETEVHTGSRLASAAYYIATPAKKILACAPTSQVGSIGIIVATYDWSKWEEEIGIKEIIITSSNAPDKHPDLTTKQGRDIIRNQLDAMERIFYSRITESRGYSAEHIVEHFGRGGMMVACDPSKEHEDGIRSGLIDGLCNDISVCSNKEEVNFVSNGLTENKSNPAPAGNKQEGQIMKLSEYLETNPAAAAEIERYKSEAKAAGVSETMADYSARVDKVLPIIQSDSYPVNIKTIACNVLAGKVELSHFEGAVIAHDSVIEAAKSEAAKNETSNSTLPDAPTTGTSEQNAVNDAWEKSIADAKARKAAKEVA